MRRTRASGPERGAMAHACRADATPRPPAAAPADPVAALVEPAARTAGGMGFAVGLKRSHPTLEVT